MKERYHGKHTEGGERPRRAKRPPLTKKQKWLIAVAAVLAVAHRGAMHNLEKIFRQF